MYDVIKIETRTLDDNLMLGLAEINKLAGFLDNVPSEHTELMQWTGFKDMPGIDIYEGDIFYHRIFDQKIPLYFVVIWENGGFRIKDTKYDLYTFLREMGSDTKVVGNIYENPELLEESNDNQGRC